MSAAAQQSQAPSKNLPKVLRIGVVQEGKIVQERLIRAGDPVTFGEGSRNTFVYAGTALGAAHTLFVPNGNSYNLAVPESIEGKISWKDGIRDISDLRAKGEMQKRGDIWHLPLSENVRGKVAVGAVTVLFQFVPAPPEPVRAVSAADFRPKIFNDDDPLFLGLLGVFNLIAVAFQVWVFLTPVPEENALDHVDDALDLLVERKPEKIIIKDNNAIDQTKAETKKPEAKTEAKKDDDGAPKPEAKPEPTAESVAKKSVLLQMLGTTGAANSDQVANDILGDAQAQKGSLDSALEGVGKVEAASADNLGLKSGGQGGKGDAAVGITSATGGEAGTGTGATVAVKKPKVDLSGEGDVSAEEGDAGGVAKVVRANKGRIETCVQVSLRQNPDLSGRVSAGWVIQQGKVSDVHVVKNTTGDPALGECIVKAVRSFRFDAGLTATVDEFPWVVSGQ